MLNTESSDLFNPPFLKPANDHLSQGAGWMGHDAFVSPLPSSEYDRQVVRFKLWKEATIDADKVPIRLQISGRFLIEFHVAHAVDNSIKRAIPRCDTYGG